MKPDTFNKIIEAVENGETLKAAIRTAQTSWRALSLELAGNEESASRYAHARTVSAQFWADKAVEAAEAAYDRDTAAVGRAKTEVYKWRAKVANPREYGDRVDVQAEVRHTVTGVIALPPEDEVQLPRTVVTARLGAGEDATVDADAATSTGEGGGGGGGGWYRSGGGACVS